MSQNDGIDGGVAAPDDVPETPSVDLTDHSSRGGASTTSDAARAHKHHLPLPLELVLLVGLALVLAIGIKAFFLQAFYVPSGSMNNTLVENDRILVEKPSYWRSDPSRGDVVVFKDPGGWLDPSEQEAPAHGFSKALEWFGLYPTGGHLVKRVIAVGGDHVVCCDDEDRVTVNGVALNEKSYLAPGEKPSLIKFDKEVPKGYLWVMGDNRSHSADSRVHMGDPGGGFVPVDDVVGKVFAVVWPLGHTQFLHRPATFDSVS